MTPLPELERLAREAKETTERVVGYHETECRIAAFVTAMSPDQCLALIERVKAAEEALRPFAEAWHYSCHPNAGEGLPWNTTPEHYEQAARALPTDGAER